MSKPNTELFLMYRDADNYKAYLTVVLAGAITDEQLAAIKPKLSDGCFIIAEQVGLPTPSFQFSHYDNWPNEDCDHVFTTWGAFEGGVPTAAEMLTDDEPTIELTVDQLVVNILAVEEWDVEKEWRRMLNGGLPEAPRSASKLSAAARWVQSGS